MEVTRVSSLISGTDPSLWGYGFIVGWWTTTFLRNLTSGKGEQLDQRVAGLNHAL